MRKTIIQVELPTGFEQKFHPERIGNILFFKDKMCYIEQPLPIEILLRIIKEMNQK